MIQGEFLLWPYYLMKAAAAVVYNEALSPLGLPEPCFDSDCQRDIGIECLL